MKTSVPHAPSKRSHSPLSRRTNLFDTPLKCHAIGVTLAVVLLGINTWVWFHPSSLAPQSAHTETEIDEAIQLITNRDEIRTRFALAEQEHKSQLDAIHEIENWLPESRNWSEVRAIIQALCAESEVQLVAIEQGSQHVGQRVAVLETRCEIQGTYVDLCSFLQKLPQIDLPLWCDEVRVVRSDEAASLEAPQGDPNRETLCLATVSIRVPFAGKGTTAEKLLKRRRSL